MNIRMICTILHVFSLILKKIRCIISYEMLNWQGFHYFRSDTHYSLARANNYRLGNNFWPSRKTLCLLMAASLIYYPAQAASPTGTPVANGHDLDKGRTGGKTDRAKPGQGQQTLLLEVTINAQKLANIIRIEKLADGRLALPIKTWLEAHLRPAGEKLALSDGYEGYALDAVKGLHYQLDGTRLTLDITAPVEAFEASTFDDGRDGGIRWARNFSLQPGYITFPMPSLSGSAALPSTIDVLVNNQLRQSQTINPSPFDLTNVPVVTGASQTNLVVRDMLGVQTLVTQSYYASPRLLAARLELQQHRQATGIELASLLGHFAVARAAAAIVNANGTQGGHYLLGLERSSLRGGGSLQWQHFDRDYIQFGALPNDIHPRDLFIAGYGMPLFLGASAGINYTSQTRWNNDPFQLAAANLNLSLPWNTNLGVYISNQLDQDKGYSGGLNLTIPLGNQRMVSVSSSSKTDGLIRGCKPEPSEFLNSCLIRPIGAIPQIK